MNPRPSRELGDLAWNRADPRPGDEAHMGGAEVAPGDNLVTEDT